MIVRGTDIRIITFECNRVTSLCINNSENENSFNPKILRIWTYFKKKVLILVQCTMLSKTFDESHGIL